MWGSVLGSLGLGTRVWVGMFPLMLTVLNRDYIPPYDHPF